MNFKELLEKVEDEELRGKLADLIGSLNEKAHSAEALARKRDELLAEVKALKEKVSTIPEDFDPKAWEEYKKGNADAEQLRAQYDAQLKAAQADYQKRLDELQTKLKETDSRYKSTVVENSLQRALAEAKGNAALLMPHLKQHVTVDDRGELLVVDPSTGHPRASRVEAGKNMTIKELVEEFKANETYAPAFLPANSGGGAGSGRSGLGNYSEKRNPFAKGTPSYNVTEQIKIQKENPELAARLKELAKAQGAK